ncbi:PotA ABC-type spermidine/putrescine transport systems, ATPase components [Rhabdaerophilaceae bacterium]
MARLTIDTVSKTFGAHAALDRASIVIEDGEFVALLGPSGCGKTTMLRLIAGFDTVSGGSITLGDRLVSGTRHHVPPEDRRMGIVFQSYALWPHMNVAENVAYALRVQGLAREQREARVRAALDGVGLGDFATRRPASLSGGQRQRVALARCLAMEPAMVLLDEPLANLDVHLRATMEEEFAQFHQRTGTTMLYITHDQAEAMALADRIAVMDHGRILQYATPSTLYREPATETVAKFIGAGLILPAEPIGKPENGGIAVEVLGHRAQVRCSRTHAPPTTMKLCVRAQDLAVDETCADALQATITRVVYQGGHFMAQVVLACRPDLSLALMLPEPTPFNVGDSLRIAVRDGWLIPGQA